MWNTLLFFANFLASLITRSLNLAPIAMIKSLSFTDILDAFVPCIPTIPVQSLCSAGNAVFPIKLTVTGMFAFSARAFNSS